MSANDIIKSINLNLETGWSKKQLARGKWFEIQSNWSPEIVQALVTQYKGVGWSVSRHAELTHRSTRIFLVIGHPSHYKRP